MPIVNSERDLDGQTRQNSRYMIKVALDLKFAGIGRRLLLIY